LGLDEVVELFGEAEPQAALEPVRTFDLLEWSFGFADEQ